MNPAPAECRILTALLLAPMASRELATCLALQRAHTCHRLSYLHKTGDVCMVGHSEGKRPAVRYALTRQGMAWAQELVA